MTSHSSTTKRTNALFCIKIGNIAGYGEVGLPPKNGVCYFANYGDVFESFEKKFVPKVKESIENLLPDQYDPFASLPTRYFHILRNKHDSKEETLVKCLFKVVDQQFLDDQHKDKVTHGMHRTVASGIEAALLDWWGKFLSIPLHELIAKVDNNDSLRGFYTVAMASSEDVAQHSVRTSATFGSKYTPHIKIKLDKNLERAQHTIGMLLSMFPNVNIEKRWSVDANSDWTSNNLSQFVEMCKESNWTRVLYMIEQPWPADFVSMLKKGAVSEEEKKRWISLKQTIGENGILLFADESIATVEDVVELVAFVHGLNVKLEKTGGIREALKVIDAANEFGLKIWIGMMVGSVLNANTAAHLLPLASSHSGDLDGSLLVDEGSQQFQGGYAWKEGGLIELSKSPGIGVSPK